MAEDQRPVTGDELRRWRQRNDWTQPEAAHQLGFSIRHYKRLEASDRLPAWVGRMIDLHERARAARAAGA